MEEEAMRESLLDRWWRQWADLSKRLVETCPIRHSGIALKLHPLRHDISAKMRDPFRKGRWLAKTAQEL